jgi:phosphotransferase system  glucose/maltose/N-acetylglucosamine-specific IIC component
MSERGMGGQGGMKKEQGTNWQKVLMPIVGLLFIGVAGIFGFILSGPITIALRQRFPQVREGGDLIQVAVGIAIFLVIIMVFAAIYAAVAAKPEQSVSEAILDREKREKLQEAQRAKRRKLEMKQKMKQRDKS